MILVATTAQALNAKQQAERDNHNILTEMPILPPSGGSPPITTTKIVVVLLGWLGAQPKSLRRYEALYRSLLTSDTSSIGSSRSNTTTTIEVKTYIAPPFTVVQAVVSPTDQSPTTVPLGWPNGSCLNTNSILTVQDMAWKVLNDVQDVENCSHFYVHAFSNGGCFVWEQIRNILLSIDSTTNNNNDTDDDDDTYRTNHPTQNDAAAQKQELLQRRSSTTDAAAANTSTCTSTSTTTTTAVRNSIIQLRQQLKGVVFDSCPIVDLFRLPEALQHCTITERIQVLRHCGYDYLTLLTNYHSNVRQRVQERMDVYVKGMQMDPLSIPQLYLYGRDDPLAPATFIDELIQYRRHRNQQQQQQQHRITTNIDSADNERNYINTSNNIMSCVWDKSRHCGHYIQHPTDYTNAIAKFLEYSNNSNTAINVENRSKL